MDMETRVSQALDFFRTNYGGRKVFLARATITDRNKTTQTFHEGEARFRPDSMALEGLVRSMIKKADKGVEVFYAPTPMSGQSGRKKEQALPNLVVYGDADNGLTPDVHARLVELGACLVRSGGTLPDGRPKYHVYLLLTKEVPPSELERLNRGLKAFIKGDKFDATTLLRVPGTRNHKYPGSPIVTVERYADARHTPENLAKFLAVPDDDTHTGGVVNGTDENVLPEISEGFNWLDNKPGYAKMRAVLREWNGRFDADNNCRRYMAAIALVKEAVKKGLTVNDAYAFAAICEPLLDKQEEENGYSIQKDIARIWRRETGMKPSGTLTAEDIVSAPQTDDARNKTVTPTAYAPLDLGPNFPFGIPNLDELLSGDYKPLEPTLVPCGTFALLYPGKSHSLVADRGMGKTHIAIAMVHEIMKAGGRVAYFDFEDTPDTFVLDRMMTQHGIPVEMIRTQFLYLNGLVDDMEDPAAALELLAERLRDWDLVIIDGVSASMGNLNDDWDESKAVDYKKWHKLMVQPFLDQGIATLQLDHSTKSGPRAGGTMQKGAKLTGVEYQIRSIPAQGFTIGRTGKVIMEAAKDRVGRIAKHRRTTPPTDMKGDEWPWNDVATFTLASDDTGRITRAKFEPINYKDTTAHAAVKAAPVSDEEHRVLRLLRDNGKPMGKSKLAAALKINSSRAYALIKVMVERGLLLETKVGNGIEISLVDNPTQREAGDPMALDFSQVDRMPKAAKRKLECHRCGDAQTYPDEFVQPDEIGYQPGRRLCRSCAGENIEADYDEPQDGPEWARRKREDIERQSRTRGRRRRS